MKIAIGGFHHETNTFAPEKADYQCFVQADSWPGLTEGKPLLDAVEGMNLGISGFINESSICGHELMPMLWCSASPSSFVTFDAYERVASSMLDHLANLMPLDAVYLDLHGAMVTDHQQDGEGELLARVRSVIGPDIPLVVSLDLHANITSRMFATADVLVGYRTYPHVDMAETGRKAAKILDKMLTGVRPSKAMFKFEFLIPLVWQCTLVEPCKSIYQQLEDIEQQNPNVLSLSFTPGFPPADIHEVGPCVVGYGTQQAESEIETAVHELVNCIEGLQSGFNGKVFSPDEAVKYAINSQNSPVVIADTQDNPGAGGNSDTLGMLRALIKNEAQSALIGLIYDPATARMAHEAGLGAEVELKLGALSQWENESPLETRFLVQALGDGNFTGSGPMWGGAKMQLGLMAALRIGDIEILVSSKKMQFADKSISRHLGIEPAGHKIIVVKSSVHFQADFDDIAGETIVAAAPGPNAADNRDLPYQNIRPSLSLVPSGASVGNGA